LLPPKLAVYFRSACAVISVSSGHSIFTSHRSSALSFAGAIQCNLPQPDSSVVISACAYCVPDIARLGYRPTACAVFRYDARPHGRASVSLALSRHRRTPADISACAVRSRSRAHLRWRVPSGRFFKWLLPTDSLRCIIGCVRPASPVGRPQDIGTQVQGLLPVLRLSCAMRCCIYALGLCGAHFRHSSAQPHRSRGPSGSSSWGAPPCRARHQLSSTAITG